MFIYIYISTYLYIYVHTYIYIYVYEYRQATPDGISSQPRAPTSLYLGLVGGSHGHGQACRTTSSSAESCPSESASHMDLNPRWV